MTVEELEKLLRDIPGHLVVQIYDTEDGGWRDMFISDIRMVLEFKD